MKIITSIIEMYSYIAGLKRMGKKTNPMTIGFVPTMGYIHQGHLSLVEAAGRDNKKVIVSIFVNPAQFGPNEDFDKYPRDYKRDLRMLKETKEVDCVFMPEKDDMYPAGYGTYVELQDDMTKILCGASRPGHFKGVTTIVSKLLNVISPDRMYVGQKDAQQALILTKLVKDLNYSAEVVICPIVREKDGLAMSSRNSYLTSEQRNSAPVIFKSIQMAESMIELGERDSQEIIKEIKRKLKEEPLEIDYVEIIDTVTLKKAERLAGKILIALAVYAGKTRLIDNTILEIK